MTREERIEAAIRRMEECAETVIEERAKEGRNDWNIVPGFIAEKCKELRTALTAPGEVTIRYACALLQGHAVREGNRVWIDAERWTEFCAVLSRTAPPANGDVPPAMRRLVAIVSDLDARGEVEPIVVDGVRSVVREYLATPAPPARERLR